MKTIAPYKLSALLWIVILQFCVQTPALSQSVLNYQGRVISGGTAFNGTGQFKFAIVSSDGSTFYWKNDRTTTAEAPATAVSLSVSKGLFSVQLGDAAIANMGTINSTVLSNGGLKLRVWFNDGFKGWQQFSPDQSVNLSNSVSFSSGTLNVDVTSRSAGNLIVADGLSVPNASIFSLGGGDWSPFNIDLGDSYRFSRQLLVTDGNYIYAIGGYPRGILDANKDPQSHVLRYDPETSQVEKVGEVSDIYYKSAPPLYYVPQNKISAIDYNSKSCLVGGKIYIVSKSSESYEVPKFGYWDLQASKWEKLDDPPAGIDGGGLFVDTSGVLVLARYSGLGGGAVDLYSPTSSWTGGGANPLVGGFPSTFGRPWFTGNRVWWFGPANGYCEVNILDPRTNLLEKAKFDWVGSPQGESYHGIQLPAFDNKFTGSSQVLICGDQLFLISNGKFYQIDLVSKKIAVKKSLGFAGSDVVYGDPPRTMLLVNGKVCVFASNEAANGIIRGYAASLRSLRNVFIQN